MGVLVITRCYSIVNLDADAPNLELLPSFFKKYPAVFIDYNRFYRLENPRPDERGRYY